MEKLINRSEWDVAVIGAGPAGSMAALEIAKLGHSVLLIDKAQFPRTKVCGSCLNPRALELLKQAGIDCVQSRLRASELREFHFAAKRQHVSLAFSGCSISREKLDHFLVHEAIDRGVHFLSQTRAAMGERQNVFRTVQLSSAQGEQIIKSRIVVIADGLSGNALKEDVHSKVRPNSRMGVSTIVNEGPAFLQPGTIYMAYSREGYVGAVRLEDGRIDIAAALAPALIKSGISSSIRTIWQEAGFSEMNFEEHLQWHGTPHLSRARRPISGERFFIIGDAASYTEPFTGEGISWALASGRAVAPIAAEALRQWLPKHSVMWQTRYQAVIGKRQNTSKWVMIFLRNSFLVEWAVKIISKFPFLTNRLVRQIQT